MLITIKGQRAFQVLKDQVKSSCREVNDSSKVKIAYLDHVYDYEVDYVIGAQLIKNYPKDVVLAGQGNSFPGSKAETKKSKKG